MTTTYLGPHRSQYEDGASPITRTSGCTWTSGATGAAATTGGRTAPTPDQVHARLARNEETNPGTPGWSIPDLVKALDRLGIGMMDESGRGWERVVASHDAGHYIVLQGDSDVFAGSTCSGAFDGDHAIGVHPRTKTEASERWWWIDDPICSTGRWERESVVRRYATKLSPSVRFGVFTRPVPSVPAPKAPPVVTLRHGARRLGRDGVVKRIHVPAGKKARVRAAPRMNAGIVRRLPNRRTRRVWQVVRRASGRWYGNRTGTRWLHASAF